MFIPQPPGGGVGPVGAGAGAIGAGALGAQKVPFQEVFGPQPAGGGTDGTIGAIGAGAGTIGAIGAGAVGAGPPLFSQDAWVVPSLQRTA